MVVKSVTINSKEKLFKYAVKPDNLSNENPEIYHPSTSEWIGIFSLRLHEPAKPTRPLHYGIHPRGNVRHPPIYLSDGGTPGSGISMEMLEQSGYKFARYISLGCRTTAMRQGGVAAFFRLSFQIRRRSPGIDRKLIFARCQSTLTPN